MDGAVKGSPLAHYVEYGALRGAAGVLGLLSLRRAGRIGEWIGKLGYWPLRVRRAVVERQVRAALPELPEAEVLRIARESYRHLGRTTIETALLSQYSAAELAQLFGRIDGWEIVEDVLSRGRGIMFVTGHLGNWELGGAYIGNRLGTIEAVARRMQNPLFDRYLTRTRRRLGVTVIPDADAVRRIPRAIREGHAVGFLADQGAAGLASTWVPFFGRQAKTPRGPAVFALRLDVPIVFPCAVRESDGSLSLHFEEVTWTTTGDRETDVDTIVAAYTSMLERWIRKYPEQYFWHHRRWKHQRPGTPPEQGDPS